MTIEFKKLSPADQQTITRAASHVFNEPCAVSCNVWLSDAQMTVLVDHVGLVENKSKQD